MTLKEILCVALGLSLGAGGVPARNTAEFTNATRPNYQAREIKPGVVVEYPAYNPYAYELIQKTLIKPGTIRQPLEREALDKAFRDFENGMINSLVLAEFIRHIDVNIIDLGDRAAFDKAMEDLPKPYRLSRD